MVTLNTALEILSGNFDVTAAETGDGCKIKAGKEEITLTNTQVCEAAVALKNLTKTLSGKVVGTSQFEDLEKFKNRVADAVGHTALKLEKISERLGCSFLWECTHTGIERIAGDAREVIDAAAVKRG